MQPISERDDEFIFVSQHSGKRTDPALSLFYSEQLKRGKEPKQIIVKIARKLLSRIRCVWLSEKPYERGVVK
jgi:transposase